MRLIDHSCPAEDCRVPLRTTVVETPVVSLGSAPVDVKCPYCGMRFGLWVPLSLAPYVGDTQVSLTPGIARPALRRATAS